MADDILVGVTTDDGVERTFAAATGTKVYPWHSGDVLVAEPGMAPYVISPRTGHRWTLIQFEPSNWNAEAA